MTIKNAADLTLRQVNGGSVTKSTFSMTTTKTIPLIMDDLIDLATQWVSYVLPTINGVQNTLVHNSSLTVQGRGYAVPSYVRPLTGGGTWGAPDSSQMPPEFAYWLRYGVDQTYNSISGTVDDDHPIKRGGAFITGVTDECIAEAAFVIPEDMEDEWALLYYAMTHEQTVGSYQWTPIVLGEAIPPHDGWRFAVVNSAAVLRITRIRSRLAV